VATTTDAAFLDALQADAFAYFAAAGSNGRGLPPDSTAEGAASSVAGVGFALTCFAVAAERGWLARADAASRTLRMLAVLAAAPMGPDPGAAGYRGFFYHFLNPGTGRRARRSELSTIDSTLLFAGALSAAADFDRRDAVEEAIRAAAERLYRRADWRWALAGGPSVSHGWRPGRGFIPYRWTGYNEALLLYVLALGSPTYPLGPEHYAAWTHGFRWRRIYGIELLFAGPLFLHQFPQVWLDLRGIADPFMRARGIDYFENSRRATLLQRDYAARNPRGLAGYGETCWGFTASDGPGPAVFVREGRARRFFDYAARGAPFGPDDGTLAPWAVAASLPFAPEIVLPTLRALSARPGPDGSPVGLHRTFNPTFPRGHETPGWVSGRRYAIHQGPMVIMAENYRSGLVWRLMRGSPYVRRGLARAGFVETGGRPGTIAARRCRA
jgi:hypothetical protein